MAGGKPIRYNWDEWFKLPKFLLVRGNHFTCGTSTMVQNVRNEACKRNIGVSIKETAKGDIVVSVRRRIPTEKATA
jgi:hypothetical protein